MQIRCGAVLFLLFSPLTAAAYSQFTHQTLIDVTWERTIRPLLMQRYPGTTMAQLTRAYSFAYGGCLIQDIGYYPFGKRFFSDLTHYVRTGDFVLALIRDARNVDEFAFALGALSHYVGGLNRSFAGGESFRPNTVSVLAARYGPVVTPEESSTAHVRTEFGFDVAQVSWKRYAPRAYRKSIGFRVARPLLYRAFHETYGIPTRGILGPGRAAVASYRSAVGKLLPLFLGAEVLILRNHLPHEEITPARDQFLANLADTAYAKYWKNAYSTPGFGAHAAAILVRVIPKIGELKALSTRVPVTETEELFVESMVETTRRFRGLLERVGAHPDLNLRLEDLDLDTGRPAVPGESKIVDRTLAELLSHLVHEKTLPPVEIRDRVLGFFQDESGPTRLTQKEWTRVRANKQALHQRYPPLL
jgi:hypothetical protein